MELSIVICTHNRAAELDRTLASLAAVAAPRGLRWETLVIDNASTDATAKVIARWGASSLAVRGVAEPLLGLCHARNRGLASAAGEAILFLDDDVDVATTLLTAYAQALRDYPAAAFFGGPILPVFEPAPTPLAEAMLAHDPAIFSGLDLGPEPMSIPTGVGPYGANMLFRRSSIGSLQFEPTISYVGHSAGANGDETHLLRRLGWIGLQGRWVPEAKVLHRIPASRATWVGLRRFAEASGRGEIRLTASDPGLDPIGLRLIIWLARDAARLGLQQVTVGPWTPLSRRIAVRHAAWRARALVVDAWAHWQAGPRRTPRPLASARPQSR